MKLGSQGQKRMLTSFSTMDEVETNLWFKQTVVLHIILHIIVCVCVCVVLKCSQALRKNTVTQDFC